MSGRSRRIVTSVIELLALGLVAGLHPANRHKPRVTQADVKRRIKRGLRMGSTEPQTVAFLRTIGVDPQNIGSSYPNRGSHSTDGFEQKDPNGRTLTASIPDAYPGFLVSGGIYMKFGFNSKGRLTRYDVRDVFTGL